MTTNNETMIITTLDATYVQVDHRARRVHDMLSESNREVNSDKASEVIDPNETLNHITDTGIEISML
eukprot:8554548-Karenia_brevis.AAC.1